MEKTAEKQSNHGGDGGKSADVPAQYSEKWIDKLDGRTQIARVIRDRLEELQTDLGGRDALSYQQRSLTKRAIWLEAVIEQQEVALSRGEEIDQGKLTQAVNSLIGLLKTLGLKRQAQEVPDLHTWMKSKGAKDEG